jgi:hypothetical protein
MWENTAYTTMPAVIKRLLRHLQCPKKEKEVVDRQITVFTDHKKSRVSP